VILPVPKDVMRRRRKTTHNCSQALVRLLTKRWGGKVKKKRVEGGSTRQHENGQEGESRSGRVT
jgi:hypothetical protein